MHRTRNKLFQERHCLQPAHRIRRNAGTLAIQTLEIPGEGQSVCVEMTNLNPAVGIAAESRRAHKPVGKRAPFQMLYPHPEGNKFSRPFEGVAPWLSPRCLYG